MQDGCALTRGGGPIFGRIVLQSGRLTQRNIVYRKRLNVSIADFGFQSGGSVHMLQVEKFSIARHSVLQPKMIACGG